MFGLITNSKSMDVVLLLTVIGSILTILVAANNIISSIVRLTNSINIIKASLTDEIHENYEKLLELKSDIRESYLEQSSRITITEERVKAIVANVEEIKDAIKKRVAHLETDIAILRKLIDDLKK